LFILFKSIDYYSDTKEFPPWRLSGMTCPGETVNIFDQLLYNHEIICNYFFKYFFLLNSFLEAINCVQRISVPALGLRVGKTLPEINCEKKQTN